MSIVFIDSVSNPSPGTSAAIDTTGATLLVAVITQTGATPPTISDSKGNSWTQFASEAGESTSVSRCYIAVNPIVGAAHTFTNASGFSSLCVAAFSGVAGIALIDISNTANPNPLQPGSITPPEDNCLVVSVIAYRDTTTLSVNSGFTLAEQRPFITATAVGSGLAYLIQTSVAAVNPEWTWTGGNASSGINLAFVPFNNGGGGGSQHNYAF